MRSICFLPAACLFYAGFASAQIDHSVGIPRYHEDTAMYRVFYGLGGNLGHVNDAPSLNNFGMTFQTSRVFFGFDLVQSSATGPNYFATSETDLDMLLGYSWDQIIPLNQARPVRIHYAIASGISFDALTHPVTDIETYGSGRFTVVDTFSTRANEASIGFPIHFSAVYEVFRHLGIGALLFYTVSQLPPSYGGSVMLEARF